MLAIVAAIVFAIALILHLIHGDPYLVTAFMLGGFVALSLYCVYPYNVIGTSRTRRGVH